MFAIFKRVKAVFENDYFHKSNDFKEGFRVCFQLFEIGYERSDKYNVDVQLHEQEEMLRKAKEVKKLLQEANDRLHKYKLEIAALKKQLANPPDIIMEMEAIRQKLDEARNAIRYQDALIKEWNANNIKNMTPSFAKQMTVIKIASVINSPEASDKQIAELKSIFKGWRILASEPKKQAG